MILCTPWGIGESIRSGRWGLFVLAQSVELLWGGHFNLPGFNVLLSLIIMGITAALLVHVLEIRKTSLCICVSAITVTIPAFATLMFFAYNVQYYALAIFLMVAAVYFLKKRGLLCFFAGAFCGCLSLSIYQAYLPFVAVLLLLTLIPKCLDHNTTPKEILLTAVKYGCALVVAYVLYTIFLHLLLAIFSMELSNYQSINTMGTFHPDGIWKAIRDVLLLPVSKFYYGFTSTPIICGGIAVCYLCVVVSIFGGKKLPLWKAVLFGLLLVLLMISANATHILAGDSVLYTRMTLGLIAVFYLPIVLLEQISFRKENLRSLLLTVLVATVLLCSANYAWQSNGNYMTVQYGNLKAENYYVTLFTRIRSAEGYREELPIVYVGKNITDDALYDNWLQTPFKYTAIMGVEAQLNQYSRDSYIKNYLGYTWRQITDEEAQKYEDQISEMRCYPDDGSIIVTEDMVLVRLE